MNGRLTNDRKQQREAQREAERKARRKMEERDSRFHHRMHGWIFGGIDAAAFAAVMTITQRDQNGWLLISACAMFSAAIPLLTAGLMFAAIAKDTLSKSYTLSDKIIDQVGAGLCVVGLGLVAWHVWWVCGVSFLAATAFAVGLSIYRVDREFIRLATESMDEAMATWEDHDAAAGSATGKLPPPASLPDHRRTDGRPTRLVLPRPVRVRNRSVPRSLPWVVGSAGFGAGALAAWAWNRRRAR